MNTESKRAELTEALIALLPELEAFGAFVAAAHLQAAVDALRTFTEPEKDCSDLA